MVPAQLIARRHATTEGGSALVLALVLVTILALGITALLGFGDTSIRTTVALRGQANETYGVDGAANAAIDALRHNGFNNNTTSTTYPKCFGSGTSDDTLVLPNFYGGGTAGSKVSSAAVKCTPDPNTGAAGGLVPITAANKPGNAILTLGQVPGEDGLNIKALSNDTPFTVHGSIVSNSTIAVSNGSLLTNAAVYAHTGCSGSITSKPAPACSSGTAADPGYAPDTTTVPPYRVPPSTCSTVTSFLPGYYDDAAALTSLMNKNSCKDTIWWFQPGAYYFDFHNANNQNPLLSGSDVWEVGVGQLVAGTPSKPLSSPVTVPGACQSPITSTTATGVQFLFGGDSQLVFSGSADAEICGTYHTNRPPIAVYGVPTGAASPVTGEVEKPGTSIDADPVWTTPTATAVGSDDANAARWTKTGNNKVTGAFTVGGAGPTSVIPAGSVLDSAQLRVAFSNSQAATGDKRTVTVTPADAGGTTLTPIAQDLTSVSASTRQVQTFDLTSSLAAAVHTKGFSAAKLNYSLTTQHAGTESVDSVQLVLGYTVPAWRGQSSPTIGSGSNCIAATPYTGNGNGRCAMIATATSSSYKGALYIQGTTYAPQAVLDLTLSNITSQVLRFGLVSRSLFVKETGAISYNGPVIEVPDNSPGYGPGGTVVYLDVYVCEGASTCSTSTGKLRLRARVLVFDPSGSPDPPKRQITVQSWALRP